MAVAEHVVEGLNAFRKTYKDCFDWEPVQKDRIAVNVPNDVMISISDEQFFFSRIP